MKKILALFGILAMVGCTVPNDGFEEVHVTGPSGQQIKILAEIADEPEERSQGLMFRQELEHGFGMLFIFDEPERLSFWMKNTLIPLDILFFDEQGQFVSRTSMQPCLADPCATYASNAPARYALEIPASDPIGAPIGEGWKLALTPR